jgi:hypothetical protein
VLSLLSLFLDIALLRRGPDSAPGTMPALWLTVAFYAVLCTGLMLLFPSPDAPWAAPRTVLVVFMFLWYRALLTLAGKPERFAQTFVSVLGYQAMLLPLELPVSWWYLRESTPERPALLPATLLLVVMIWSLVVNVRIVRAALEWPTGRAIAIVIAKSLTAFVLMLALFRPVAAP